jgi:hypothetical protein
MGRWRYRVRLEDGLKLDLNRLFLDGVANAGEVRRAVITWFRGSSDDMLAAGIIEADFRQEPFGWITINVGKLERRLQCSGEWRNFGGIQWYFICRGIGARASASVGSGGGGNRPMDGHIYLSFAQATLSPNAQKRQTKRQNRQRNWQTQAGAGKPGGDVGQSLRRDYCLPKPRNSPHHRMRGHSSLGGGVDAAILCDRAEACLIRFAALMREARRG